MILQVLKDDIPSHGRSIIPRRSLSVYMSDGLLMGISFIGLASLFGPSLTMRQVNGLEHGWYLVIAWDT